MTSRTSLSCALVLSLVALACRPSSSSEVPRSPAAAAAASDAAVATLPRQVRVPWGARLFLQAGEGPSWVLSGDEQRDGPGRVVGVIEREGDYWRVATGGSGDPRDALEPRIEHLQVYALEMYVEVDAVEPIEPIEPIEPTPAPPAQAEHAQVAMLIGTMGPPPLQSGLERPGGEVLDWRVSSGVEVFWPSGDAAGSVVEAHAFLAEAERARGGAAGELRCFAVALGPRPSEGTLCFAEAALAEGRQEEFRAWDELESEELASELEGLLGDHAIIGVLGSEPVDELVEGGGGGRVVVEIRDHEELGRREAPLPVVEARDFVIAGPDPAQAQRVVELRLRSVATCAAEAEAREQALPGTLSLSLEVAASGKVVRAQLEGEGEAGLRACIERAARRWRFKSQAPGALRLTLVFAE